MKFITKTFAAVVCLIVFASAIHAQEKPQALKFDEFDDTTSDYFAYLPSPELTFYQRLERYIKQLKKERTAAAYIIYYQARVNNEDSRRDLASQISGLESKIQYQEGLKIDVKTIDGGYRDKRTIEFWIVPKNASPPAPTPTIEQSDTYICPNISVGGIYSPTEPDALNFAVSEYDLKKIPKYNLRWKVEGGEIVGGQETNTINVKLNDNRQRATAYLEVNGLPLPCPKIFSATAAVMGKLFLIDEFGRAPNGMIKGRLDYYFTQLQNNPMAKSYIVNYGSRVEGTKTLARRIALINGQFKFRAIDMSNVTFIKGGYRETEATEIWLSFDENEKPVPIPTVDAKFVETPTVKKSTSRKR